VDDIVKRNTFTCLTCGTVHFSSDAYIACRDSHPPPSLIDRLRFGSIDDDLLDAAKEAADTIERLRSELQNAKNKLKASGRTKLREENERLRAELLDGPHINRWALREVWFDDNGEPSLHREPEQASPVAAEVRRATGTKPQQGQQGGVCAAE
jgi:hypothetical protein